MNNEQNNENKITYSRPRSLYSCRGELLSVSPSSSLANSSEASLIDRISDLTQIMDGFAVSSLKDNLYEAIDKEWRTAHADGWDGPNSVRVTVDTKKSAEAFVNLLSFESSFFPEIFATGAGAIAFEWTVEDEELTVLVKDKKIVFSYISSEKRQKGMFVFKNSLENIAPILSNMSTTVRSREVA